MPRTLFLALAVLVALVVATALVPTLVTSVHTVSATFDSLGTTASH